MNAAPSNMPEAAAQRVFLCSDVGRPGSGAVRYAAAMYFFHVGMMSQDMLEIYRRCCKFDREDPVDLASFEGVQIPSIAAPNISTQSL